MIKHVRIRTAASSDIRERGELGIRDLYNEVRRSERAQGRSPLAPPHYVSWTKAFERKDGSVTALIAQDTKGKIVGFALATHSRRDDSSTLYKLVIAPEAQGMGLGKRLVEKVVAAAKHQGKSILHVSAEHGEAHASGFYQSLGFECEGTKESKQGVGIDSLTLKVENFSGGTKSR